VEEVSEGVDVHVRGFFRHQADRPTRFPSLPPVRRGVSRGLENLTGTRFFMQLLSTIYNLRYYIRYYSTGGFYTANVIVPVHTDIINHTARLRGALPTMQPAAAAHATILTGRPAQTHT
jgi:hypothetical protein